MFWGDGSSSDGYAGGGPYQSFAPQPDHAYSYSGEFTMTVIAGYTEETPPDYSASPVYETHALQAIDVSVNPPTITAVGDTTATVEGDTYSLTVGYSHDASLGNHHVPLYYQIAWGDSSSDRYYPDQYGNLPTVPTHLYANASTSGSTYSPDVTAYTDEGAFSPATQASVIVAQPMMSVIESGGSALDRSMQHGMGAFVTLDDGDYGDRYDSSGDPISDVYQTSLSSADPDLVEVTLNGLPTAVGGTYSVSWNTSDFNVYADPYKNEAVTSGQTYSATAAHTVYIEGVSISPQTGVNVLKLSWTNVTGLGAALSVPNADFAGVNVETITGAVYVPQNGQYLYRIQGPNPVYDLEAWNVTGGIIGADSAGGEGVYALWNQGATFGSVTFTTEGSLLQIPVRVFSIQVGQGTFFPGVPARRGTGPYSKNSPAGTSPFSVFSTSGNPGLSWTAPITISGPLKTGAVNPDNGGIGLLRVGFIQNVTQGGYTDIGYYTNPANPNPLTRTSSSDNYFNRYGPVLDGPPGAGPNNPWYVTPGHVGPWQPSLAVNSTNLADNDTPGVGTPLDFHKDADAANVRLSANPLFKTDVEISFALYVCAETTQAINGANLIYAAESVANWQFNGSGTIGKAPGYTWTKLGAAVTPPTGWNPLVPSTVPQTGGMIANDVVDAAKFS